MTREPKVGACPGCGTPLAADDERCPTCGRDVEGAPRHSKYARETEDRPDPQAPEPEPAERWDERKADPAEDREGGPRG